MVSEKPGKGLKHEGAKKLLIDHLKIIFAFFLQKGHY